MSESLYQPAGGWNWILRQLTKGPRCLLVLAYLWVGLWLKRYKGWCQPTCRSSGSCHEKLYVCGGPEVDIGPLVGRTGSQNLWFQVPLHHAGSASRSDPDFLQIIASALGPEVCGILCATLKSGASFSHSTLGLLKVSPTGFQRQIFSGLVFLVQGLRIRSPMWCSDLCLGQNHCSCNWSPIGGSPSPRYGSCLHHDCFLTHFMVSFLQL